MTLKGYVLGVKEQDLRKYSNRNVTQMEIKANHIFTKDDGKFRPQKYYSILIKELKRKKGFPSLFTDYYLERVKEIKCNSEFQTEFNERMKDKLVEKIVSRLGCMNIETKVVDDRK